MELALLDQKNGAMIREYMPTQQTLDELARFFSAFSDATRIKIITALALTSMCVNDLSAVLDINQTTISHQLRLLKNAGLVKCARQGKVVFYELSSASAVDSIMCYGVDFYSHHSRA